MLSLTKSLLFVCAAAGVLSQQCAQPCSGANEICVMGSCVQVTDCECAIDFKTAPRCNNGTDEASCLTSGCCWDSRKGRCHERKTNVPTVDHECTANVDPLSRLDAGWPRITENMCYCVGGCWDNSVKSVPWCFVPDDKDCTQKILDIIIILDRSGSINSNEMALQKQFADEFLASFTISDSDTRVGLIKYDYSASTLNNLNADNSYTLVSQDINQLTSGSGSTNIGAGLQEMSNMFTSQGGSNQKVAILITDGYHNYGDPLTPIINSIPGDVNVFSVGVDGYNKAQLEEIASDPSQVYTVQQFTELATLVNDLRVDIC